MTTLRSELQITSKNTKVANNYNFDPSNSRLSINEADFGTILYAINTTDNIIIYNPSIPGLGGDTVNNVTSLDFDISSMDSMDKILVLYDALEDTTGSEDRTNELLKEMLSVGRIIKEHLEIINELKIEKEN